MLLIERGQLMNRFLQVSFLLFISSHAMLFAQIAGAGSIQGVVSDSSAAVIQGAIVTATNNATGVKTERQTTGGGLYNLSPLPPGEYTVTIKATGFQDRTQQHVTVDAL